MAFRILDSFEQTVPKRPGSHTVWIEVLLVVDTSAWFRRYKIVYRFEDYINVLDMSFGEPAVIGELEQVVFKYFNEEKAKTQFKYLRNRAIARERLIKG